MQQIPIDDEGRFAGYASVFDRLDESGDTVLRGAFRNSLAKRGQERVRMLFQHDPKEPVGVWETIAEDGFGLWVEGRLTPGVPRADALRRLIEWRAIDGLSIGFRTVKAKREGTGHRSLTEIDLWEISIVTFPMMDAARIVRSVPASRRGYGPAVGDAPPQSRRMARSLEAAITLLNQ